nr:hypothetical protein [Eubacterium sp.]
MKTTEKLQVYIKEHEICVDDIVAATGVEKVLLSGEAEQALNATELLEVCAYLKIDPKEIAGI